MFQPDYLRAVMQLGEADAEARLEEIANLVSVDRPQRFDAIGSNIGP